MREYRCCERCGRQWRSDYICPECVERMSPMTKQEFDACMRGSP